MELVALSRLSELGEAIRSNRRLAQETREHGEHGTYIFSWFERHILRTGSIYLSTALVHLRASPAQVTIASGVVAAAGCVFLALGSYPLIFVGVLGIYLSMLLDCVDGEVARLTGRASRAGQRLDALIGIAIWLGVTISFGIGISRALDSVLPAVLGLVSAVLIAVFLLLPKPTSSASPSDGPISAWVGRSRVLRQFLTMAYGVLGHGAQGLTHGILATSALDAILPGFGIESAYARLSFAAVYALGVFVTVSVYFRAAVRQRTG